MIRSRLALNISVLAAVFAVERAAHASCAPGAIMMGHLGSSYFEGFPEENVTADVFVFGHPSINFGGNDIICAHKDDPVPDALQCSVVEGGAIDDERIAIASDWGNPVAVGCPQVMVAGDLPNVILISASKFEGTTPHAGVYLLVSIAYGSGITLGYLIEQAHMIDGAMAAPMHARPIPQPVVVSSNAATGKVNLSWAAAVTDDDCAPGTWGQYLGTCTDFPGQTRPTLGPYNIYRTVAPCDAPPTTGLAIAWNFVGSTQETTFQDTIPIGPDCTYYALGLSSEGFSTKWVSAHSSPISRPNTCIEDKDCAGNACSAGACSASGCVYSPLPDGTPCQDGNPCNGAETCARGVCVQGSVEPGCCNTDADCLNDAACVTMTCDTQFNVCIETPVPGCCSSDYDCGAGESCVDHVCTLDGQMGQTSSATSSSAGGASSGNGQTSTAASSSAGGASSGKGGGGSVGSGMGSGDAPSDALDTSGCGCSVVGGNGRPALRLVPLVMALLVSRRKRVRSDATSRRDERSR